MAETAAVRRRGADVWGRGHRVLTLGLIFTVSMTAFEAMAVATVLPATVADIGGLAYYGWAFSGFMLAEIVGISIAGAAGDRRGLAPAYTAGGALFIAGLLAAGSAPSMPILIASRVLQGLGAGAISTLSYAAVARGYGDAARPHMMALLSSAWVVPGLIGPALAGTIAAYAGWRWVFLGLAPLSIVAVTLAVPAMRRLGPSAAPATSGGSTPAALGLAVGTAALLVAPTLPALLAAAPLAIAGAAVSLPSLRRLLPVASGDRSGALTTAVVVMALLSAAFFGAEAFVPLSLTDVRGRSLTLAGITLTAATLCWTAGAWIQARLAERHSRRTLIIAGLVIMAAGIAGVASVLAPSVPVAVAPVAWGLAGLGVGIAYSTTALVVLESAPAGEEGSASAALQLGNVLGTAIGTGAGGAVLARATAAGSSTGGAITTSHTLAWLAALAAIAFAARLPGRKHRS